MEGNRIRYNRVGVSIVQATPDLGGGVTGSLGNNTFAKNTDYDVRVAGASVDAQNNTWDHVPPEKVVSITAPQGTGTDLSVTNGNLIVDTSGAKPYLIITYIPKLPFLPQP